MTTRAKSSSESFSVDVVIRDAEQWLAQDRRFQALPPQGDPKALVRDLLAALREQEKLIAGLHALIADLWAVTDPEGQDAELMARVHRTLGADSPDGHCGNAICAQLTEVKAEIAQLREQIMREW